VLDWEVDFAAERHVLAMGWRELQTAIPRQPIGDERVLIPSFSVGPGPAATALVPVLWAEPVDEIAFSNRHPGCGSRHPQTYAKKNRPQVCPGNAQY
jgi:hypothetical protein